MLKLHRIIPCDFRPRSGCRQVYRQPRNTSLPRYNLIHRQMCGLHVDAQAYEFIPCCHPCRLICRLDEENTAAQLKQACSSKLSYHIAIAFPRFPCPAAVWTRSLQPPTIYQSKFLSRLDVMLASIDSVYVHARADKNHDTRARGRGTSRVFCRGPIEQDWRGCIERFLQSFRDPSASCLAAKVLVFLDQRELLN